MKLLAIFIGLILNLILRQAHATPAQNPIDFSIDIDGTIFNTIYDPRQVENTADLVSYKGIQYKPTYGAVAFIQSLIDIPNSRITFNSGADADRNRYLLSRIKMKDGKSALEHSYKVLSREDLIPVRQEREGEHLRTHQKFKKDLKKINADSDLSRTIHIDDIADYVLPEQRQNVLAIDPAYSYVENYSRAVVHQRQGMKLPHAPPSRAHWALDSQRLLWARGVIEEALDLTRRNPEISFRDAVQLLQSQPDQRRFLEAGKMVLNHYRLERTLIAQDIACPPLVARLYRRLLPYPNIAPALNK